MTTFIEREQTANTLPDPRDVDGYLRYVTAANRTEYRVANAFFKMPGELELHQIASSKYFESASDESVLTERLVAQELLDELAAKREAAIMNLPPLEDVNGRPTGTTVSDRFWAVVNEPMLQCLDLGRVKQTTWNGANRLLDQFGELLQALPTDRFRCELYESNEENCGMHISTFNDAMREQTTLYLARNRLVGVIYDDLKGEVFKIRKRSGFKLTSTGDDADSGTVRRLFDAVEGANEGNEHADHSIRLVGAAYNDADRLIRDRPGVTTPFHANLYLFREQQEVEPFQEDPTLAGYPELLAARAEYARAARMAAVAKTALAS